MTHVLTHRVRYHEADAQGFLFNSRFLELADVAMTEFFRLLGWPYANLVSAGVDPSVAAARLEFARPARFEDVLAVDVSCEHVGRSSFRLVMQVTRDEAEIAVISIDYVNVDPALEASRPLPGDVTVALRTHAAAEASVPVHDGGRTSRSRGTP